MRRTVSVLAGTAAALLALSAPAMSAPQDSVTGAGTIVTNEEGGTVHVTVSARKPADGDSTTGTGNVVIKLAGQPAQHGTVECVAVRGNRAQVAAKLDGDETTYVRITIVDTGDQSPDSVAIKFNDSGFGCSIGETGSDNPVQDGNFTVVDN